MKKLIAPALLVLTVFASCSKDEIAPPTKADILTTNVEMTIKDSKSLTGKMANNNIEGGSTSQNGGNKVAFTTGGGNIVANLKDINFEFSSNVYAGYKVTKFVDSTDTNNFNILDVALGSNTIKVNAKSRTTDGVNYVETNQFVETPPTAAFNTIADYKTYLGNNEPAPYLEYETYQQEVINAGGNTINVALQPVTGKIATAFRLSDNDIANNVSYKVTAHNVTMNSSNFININSSGLAQFKSWNKDAKTGNSIIYTIEIYDAQGTLLKTYDNVTENFLNGKAVNTIYFINQNNIYKDTATVTLSLLDLADENSEKPLD